MTELNKKPQKLSPFHGLPSLILPGLGQVFSGQFIRGFVILAVSLIGFFLTAWTIAQKARYPDVGLATRIFSILLLQYIVLGILFVAVGYLIKKAVKKDVSTTLITIILGVIYLVAGLFLNPRMVDATGTTEEINLVFITTAVFAAMVFALFWFWQVYDAMICGGKEGGQKWQYGILLFCLLIVILGFNITEIDVYKAVQEIADTKTLLVRIFWPWEAAFEYDVASIEAQAKIQAPCPDGTTGPEMNVPLEGEPWVIASPNCGDLSYRDMKGNIEYGTEMSLVGGGFTPGETVEIKWKNPIGNPFKPRGFGETSIPIDENGEFESTLIIPDALVVEGAEGDQIHKLVVVQEDIPIFTFNLSEDMKLALEGILETIMMGLMATFVGVILSAPLAFLAARNIMSPIVTRASAFSGGMVGMVLGIFIGNNISGRITSSIGGLIEAPIQTAIIFFLFFFTFAYLGWKLGSLLMEKVALNLPPSAGRILTAIGFAAIAAGIGYLLGVGFNNGILGIILGDQAEAYLTTSSYVGAGIFALAGFLYGMRTNADSQFRMGSIIYTIARILMNVVRSIEPLIWAIIAVIWVGLGPFAGFIALTLHTVAALGKLYSEAIESIDHGPIEALQATGATQLQTIIFAIVPQIMPPWISFTIYRWDINVRMSTIIGMVGGGGIGFIVIQWMRLFQYDSVGLAVWLITITVAVLDFVSSEIRERYI